MSGSGVEDHFSELSDALSATGRWWLDLSTHSSFVSPEVFKIHGFESAGGAAKLSDLLKHYDREDRRQFEALISRATGDGEGFEFQPGLANQQGASRRIQCRAACRRDASGKVDAIVGVFQDVRDKFELLESLKSNINMYQLLSKHMSDIIARVNRHGMADYISPAIEKVLGYKPDDLISKPLDQFVHPDDQSIIRASLLKMVNGAADVTVECRARHQDGRYVWVEARAALALGEDGSPNIVVSIRDASQRKAAEQEVAERLALYKLLTENSRDAVIQLDMRGVLQYASPSFFEMLGLDPDIIVGGSVDRFLHPDDAELARKAFIDALTGGSAGRAQYRLIGKDGRVVWVEAGPVAVRDPATLAPIGVTDVLRDITDRKKTDALLELSQSRYRLLADNAADVISRAAPDGAQIYLSPSVKAVLGYEPEELIGRQSYSFIHPEDHDKIAKAYLRYVEAGPNADPVRVEFRAIRKDGETRWLESHSRAMFDDLGRLVEFQDISRDVTERKRLEAALTSARAEAEMATALKAEFISNVSHELRTPLTSILGFSAMLTGDEALSDRARLLVERVNQSGQALLAQVDDILDFSKLESGLIEIDPRPTDLHAVLEGAIAMMEVQASKKALALQFVKTSSLPSYGIIDEGRLRQILLNLISNAVKFTAEGRVELKASYDASRSVLRCEVVDTGPGIPADRLERLFKRFSQVDASTTRLFGGTGLGLAICKGLVEAMGGTIGVQTEPGQGSCFWIETPCPPSRLELSTDDPEAGQAEADLRGLSILVVDDHPANRELVRMILEPFDLQVTEASSGAEAISILGEVPFDVVLMDIRMPDVNGIQAAQMIRSGQGPNHDTCILAFSADAVGVSDDAVYAEIFDGGIAKPFIVSEVLAKIHQGAANRRKTVGAAQAGR